MTALGEARWVFAGLLTALVAATLAGRWLARNRNSRAIENLNVRIRSWWIMILIGGLCYAAGGYGITGLFAALSLLALREFVPRAGISPILYLAAAAQYAFVAAGWHLAFLASIPVCSLFLAIRNRTVASGLLVCVYGPSHIPALAVLGVESDEGRSALPALFAVVIAQSSDVFQYIWGKLLGRHPIAPRSSPLKTWEGFAGGVLSAAALGAMLSPLTPHTGNQAALVSMMIAGTGFLGGLILSAVKRARGIKDWGHLIRGHGGVLDRLDSLWLSAPLYFHLLRSLP